MHSNFPLSISLRKRLLASTSTSILGAIGEPVMIRAQANRPFSGSQAVAERYQFVGSDEVRKALEQFCTDIGIQDEASVEEMSKNRVLRAALCNFWSHRKYFQPDPQRDLTGCAAADFMAAQTISSLLEVGAVIGEATVSVPLMQKVMERGADGLFTVGQTQFDELAQMTIDVVDWLARGRFNNIVLIEAPLGNSVPVAVLQRLARSRGLNSQIVEWACPRNDRAASGRTVEASAQDLATDPAVKSADMIVFADDAITGSRFLKMAKALRKAVGPTRVASIAMRVRYNPKAKFKVSPVRDLSKVNDWAKPLGLPYGLLVFSDLPLFKFDNDGPALFQSALAWGDSALTAGKRKANIIYYFLDRYEAIYRQLALPGESPARDLLTQELWACDTSGQQFKVLPLVARDTFCGCINALPKDFFARIRASAEAVFPDEVLGQRITSVSEVRRRTDWLAHCVFNEAVKALPNGKAHLLANAILTLSSAGFDAGAAGPSRDHSYGQGTFPLPPGEDALHIRLVDRIKAEAEKKTPRRHGSTPATSSLQSAASNGP